MNQRTMDEMISYFNQQVSEMDIKHEDKTKLLGMIMAIGFEAQKHKWIPWDSGHLPDESGTYTVTAYDGVTKRVTYAKYQKRLKRWELTGARAYWRVLAWMPLPKPFKGGDQE